MNTYFVFLPACFLTQNPKDSLQKDTMHVFHLSEKLLITFKTYLPQFILHPTHQKKFVDLQNMSNMFQCICVLLKTLVGNSFHLSQEQNQW